MAKTPKTAKAARKTVTDNAQQWESPEGSGYTFLYTWADAPEVARVRAHHKTARLIRDLVKRTDVKHRDGLGRALQDIGRILTQRLGLGGASRDSVITHVWEKAWDEWSLQGDECFVSYDTLQRIKAGLQTKVTISSDDARGAEFFAPEPDNLRAVARLLAVAAGNTIDSSSFRALAKKLEQHLLSLAEDVAALRQPVLTGKPKRETDENRSIREAQLAAAQAEAWQAAEVGNGLRAKVMSYCLAEDWVDFAGQDAKLPNKIELTVDRDPFSEHGRSQDWIDLGPPFEVANRWGPEIEGLIKKRADRSRAAVVSERVAEKSKDASEKGIKGARKSQRKAFRKHCHAFYFFAEALAEIQPNPSAEPTKAEVDEARTIAERKLIEYVARTGNRAAEKSWRYNNDGNSAMSKVLTRDTLKAHAARIERIRRRCRRLG